MSSEPSLRVLPNGFEVSELKPAVLKFESQGKKIEIAVPDNEDFWQFAVSAITMAFSNLDEDRIKT